MIAMHADLLLRVLAGTMLGAVIGYERRIHGRPAGLRTHLLVALAASVFMVVSTNFVYFQHYGNDDMVRVDGMRDFLSMDAMRGVMLHDADALVTAMDGLTSRE